MAETFVGRLQEFSDGMQRIIEVDGIEIGVFYKNGQFYGYENMCLHQGGPACEGITIPKVEDIIQPDKTCTGARFVEEELHFVCPWHGYEYNLDTGQFVGDKDMSLRKFEVIQKGDEIFVLT